jgi:hypothetical protein
MNEYDTLEDFMDEWGGADDDYNLLFRWDWSERDYETDEPIEFTGDMDARIGTFSVYYAAQRKGYIVGAQVKVCRNDEPAVIEYLKSRQAYLNKLWEPL